MPRKQGEELFLVEGRTGQSFLYAPLRRAIVSVNRAAAGVAARYLREGEDSMEDRDMRVIERLRSAGLFTEPYPAPPMAPEDYVFRPHEVTLFTTTRCNLRCVYCYAEAGKRHLDMPWEIARPAIDQVVSNSLDVGRKDFIVGFHGGGEPTMNWSLIEQATLYARRRAQETGLVARIHSATNGLLSSEQLDFVIEHFTGLNISFDGPADIQDRQRPRPNGSGSFDHVMRTIARLNEAKFRFGIRVTLTDGNASRLVEIVRFFRETCPGLDQLHVEPVWQCGRCKTTGSKPPSEDEFIEHFIEAQEVAESLGMPLFYSGARLDVLSDSFCAAAGDGFSVTPEGAVTSCFEVSDPADPRSELFHYGIHDADQGGFVLDQSKIAALRRLRVENLSHCSDCFCKWHCAGDCLAKSLTTDDGPQPQHHGSPRCRSNREITRMQLERVAARGVQFSDAIPSRKDESHG